jgi:hypothetical protein
MVKQKEIGPSPSPQAFQGIAVVVSVANGLRVDAVHPARLHADDATSRVAVRFQAKEIQHLSIGNEVIAPGTIVGCSSPAIIQFNFLLQAGYSHNQSSSAELVSVNVNPQPWTGHRYFHVLVKPLSEVFLDSEISFNSFLQWGHSCFSFMACFLL